jgi:hypothetical protein
MEPVVHACRGQGLKEIGAIGRQLLQRRIMRPEDQPAFMRD